LTKFASNPIQRTIAIAAGGTAGHINTGIAIAQQYRNEVPTASIVFVTEPGQLPEHILQRENWQSVNLPSAPWMRTGLKGKFRAVWSILKGFVLAKRLLKSLQPDVVIGCGGYSSVALILAAYSMRITCVLHEANAIPGRANRLLARFSKRIYLGWPEAQEQLEQNTVVTGIPLRLEFLNFVPQCNTLKQSRNLLIVGGSLGSSFLNRHGPDLAAHLTRQGVKLRVKHQTGQLENQAIQRAYLALGIDAEITEFIDDITAAYYEADFVICCAGAITLAELAATGVPCLIVPLKEASDDHQTANVAAYFEALKQRISQHALTNPVSLHWTSEQHWQAEPLAQQIADLLRDTSARMEHIKLIHEIHRPDAAKNLVTDCEQLLNRA